MTDGASEPQIRTATVSAPPEASALVLGGGTGRLHDQTRAQADQRRLGLGRIRADVVYQVTHRRDVGDDDLSLTRLRTDPYRSRAGVVGRQTDDNGDVNTRR